jgi:high-affinity nickel permease
VAAALGLRRCRRRAARGGLGLVRLLLAQANRTSSFGLRHAFDADHIAAIDKGWAFSNPVRKVYYNITVASLSVAVALIVGSIELLHVLGWMTPVGFERLGYAIVALFVLTWAGSVAIWKGRRIEERWCGYLDTS